MYCFYIYITRLASNEIFLPSNKIYREVGRAKDLISTPVYRRISGHANRTGLLLYRTVASRSDIQRRPGRRGFGSVAGQFCIVVQSRLYVPVHPTTSVSRLYGGGINCPVNPHDTYILTTESRGLRIWEVLA